MASGWTAGKRSRAAVAALILLSGCTPQYGWQGEAASGSVEISRDTETVLLTIQLDEGYEAADEFTQRVTLHHSGGSVEMTRADFREPFVVPVEPGTLEAELSFTIGFCESTRKDLCFVEQGRLTITRNGREATGRGEFSVAFRPQPPRL